MSDDGMSLPNWLTARPGDGRGNSRKLSYKAFLKSPEWRKVRADVLADLARRQGVKVPICEGEGCEEQATTVHHEEYEKILANTPRKKLRGACVGCQLREREGRILRHVMGYGRRA